MNIYCFDNAYVCIISGVRVNTHFLSCNKRAGEANNTDDVSLPVSQRSHQTQLLLTTLITAAFYSGVQVSGAWHYAWWLTGLAYWDPHWNSSFDCSALKSMHMFNVCCEEGLEVDPGAGTPKLN